MERNRICLVVALLLAALLAVVAEPLIAEQLLDVLREVVLALLQAGL